MIILASHNINQPFHLAIKIIGPAVQNMDVVGGGVLAACGADVIEVHGKAGPTELGVEETN